MAKAQHPKNRIPEVWECFVVIPFRVMGISAAWGAGWKPAVRTKTVAFARSALACGKGLPAFRVLIANLCKRGQYPFFLKCFVSLS